MNTKEFKTIVYAGLAQAAKSLSDPGRLEILDMVLQAPKSVEQLALETRMSIAAASHHLQRLKQAGLVKSEKEGRYVIYSQTSLGRQLFTHLSAAGEEHIADIRVAMHDFFGKEGIQAVDEKQMIRKARAGHILLIDVRPSLEYEAGHIQGAISVPVKDIGSKLKSLPKSKATYAYCRGRYCVLSMEAVAILRRKGYRVSKLNRGPLDFQAKGIPLARGT